MYIKRIVQISFILILFFNILGCAYLSKGPSQNIYIISEPNGAEVYVNYALRGETPVILNLECKGEYEIVLKKEGYYSQRFKLKREMVFNWLLLDMIFGVTILGDAITGSWYRLTPEVIDVILIENKNNEITSYNNFQLELKSIELKNTYRLNI